MKIYIRAVTIDDLRAQYGKDPGMTKEKFKTLFNLDPTGDYDSKRRGKYAPWIFKQNRAGNLTENDYGNVTDALSDLADAVRRRRYEVKDINQYATVQDLIDAHLAAQDVQLELSQRQQTRNAHREAKEAERKRLAGEDTGDIKEIVTDGTWTVYQPLTWAGNIALAYIGVDKEQDFSPRNPSNMKARWCTAGEGDDRWWREYSQQCPIYVFINSADPINKFQTCLGADNRNSWWYDKVDHEYGESAFFDFLDDHRRLKEFFKVRDEGGVNLMGDTIRGYVKDAVEIIIPEGVTQLPRKEFPKSCITVTLPDSLTTISDSAFKNTNVETLIGGNIRIIGKNAFEGSAIRDIDLSNVSIIDNGAFQNCTNLTSVNYNDHAKLGAYAFAGCTGLRGPIVQPTTVTIASGTFNGCSNLTLIWEDADFAYPIDDIALLKLDVAKYPQLVAQNEGYIDIEDIG